MYDWEITSRLGHGLRMRQPKLGTRMNRRPGVDRKRQAAAATGPVCGATRYAPAGRRAGGGVLRGGKSEDEAKDSEVGRRGSRGSGKEDRPARESREIEELSAEEEALEEAVSQAESHSRTTVLQTEYETFG